MATRIGYGRVSTNDHDLDLQRDALLGAGCNPDHLYLEKVDGAAAARPEFEQCLKALQPGNTLVVCKLDRLGRSFSELVRIAADLRQKGVFIELVEPRILFDDSSVGKAMSSMFAMFAEFERDLIRERTQAGLAAARARGRKGGRKPALDAKQIEEIKLLLGGANTQLADVAKLYGVSRTTIYKYVGIITPKLV